jgi:DNA-directed RNA polymerase subunit RPC12/RpoP
MALDQKTRVTVVLGLIVLALIVGIIQLGRGCHHKAQARKALMRPFWCEKCQKEFMAPWRDITATCPDCKQETSVVRYYYVCRKCGERFHAYDLNLSTQDMRLHGEEWGPPIYPLPEFECPKCHSKETALERYNRR